MFIFIYIYTYFSRCTQNRFSILQQKFLYTHTFTVALLEHTWHLITSLTCDVNVQPPLFLFLIGFNEMPFGCPASPTSPQMWSHLLVLWHVLHNVLSIAIILFSVIRNSFLHFLFLSASLTFACSVSQSSLSNLHKYTPRFFIPVLLYSED